jgi:hypothetical protein
MWDTVSAFRSVSEKPDQAHPDSYSRACDSSNPMAEAQQNVSRRDADAELMHRGGAFGAAAGAAAATGNGIRIERC